LQSLVACLSEVSVAASLVIAAIGLGYEALVLIRVARSIAKLDKGLLRTGMEALTALVDWAKIYLAYGSKKYIPRYILMILLHISLLLIFVNHLPHLLSSIGVSIPNMIPYLHAKIIGLLAIASLIAIEVARFTQLGLHVKVLGLKNYLRRLAFTITLLATIFSGIVGIEILHFMLAPISLALAIVMPEVRHFILLSWLRPLIVFISVLASKNPYQR